MAFIGIGEGTKDSPYIVNSWKTFMSALDNKLDSAFTYIEFDKDAENKIIDLNDVLKEDATAIPDTINLGITCIYGNEWEIRNLYWYNNTKTDLITINGGTCYMYNLHWLNMYVYNNTSSTNYLFRGSSVSGSFGNYQLIAYNCKFSGLLLKTISSNAKLICFASSTLNYCSLNFKTHSGNRNYNVCFTGTMNYCNIYIDGYISNKITTSNSNSLFTTNFHSCVIDGKLVLYNDTTSSNKYYYLFYSTSTTDLYCKLHITEIKTEDATNITLSNTCNNAGCIVFKKSNIDDTISLGENTGINYLTDEQLIDTAYLENIGFPIGV